MPHTHARTRPLRAAAVLAAVLLSSAPALAQRANDPSQCPYCKGDPALMEAAGVVSHGGFEFGRLDTAGIDELLATADIRWIETPHFEIGFGIGAHKVKQDEKAKIRAELTELAAALPTIDPRAKVLDPWLRAHIYARRSEKVWDRFLELLQVEASDFPDGKRPWDGQGKYMGEGPYVGHKGKFEVLIVPSQAALAAYLTDQFGLLTRQNQRWHLLDRGTLSVTINAQEGQLRQDGALHGHLAFNLAINLLDGFKHYNYDTPTWLREGFGHFVEREIDPKFNTFDSSEGAVAQMTRQEDWEPEVRKLLAKGEAPRMAELINLRGYAELTLAHHFATWSMVDFLVREHPEGFACLNDKLHGRLDAKGFPDGARLPDAHRDAFKECLGMSYPDFDRAWAAWVEANYRSR